MDFGNMWKNYKDNTRRFERGDHCMQRHFKLQGHSGLLKDLSVTLIQKNRP